MEHLQDIQYLDKFYKLVIQHFFGVYKALEPGKSVEGATWVGRTQQSRRFATPGNGPATQPAAIRDRISHPGHSARSGTQTHYSVSSEMGPAGRCTSSPRKRP